MTQAPLPRVLFLGMDGPFSRAPLAALLEAGFPVCALIVPRPPAMTVAGVHIRRLDPPSHPPYHIPLLPMPSEPNAIGLAWRAGVPVLEVARLAEQEVLAALSALQPDVICVACFPYLLPPALLRLPRHGALNVHPSLLPAYRGPSPLFWIFHDGLEHAGVTVHLMDERADSGDIVARSPVTLPDGISYGQAERRCAAEGARLLVEALGALAAGRLSHTPQPQRGTRYAITPAAAHCVVTPDWPARRAYNFIRGVEELGLPITIQIGADRVTAHRAHAFSEQDTQLEPVKPAGRRLMVRCTPGVLVLTVAAG